MSRRKEQQAIDEILGTLYALDVQGYVLDEKIMKGEALNRIGRTLARLDNTKRKTIEDETRYRLDQFEKFSRMKREERDHIIQLARERKISIEEAYRLAAQE